MRSKLENLRARLLELGSVLVAYSGGVDSSFLLKVAYETLKGKVLAVIACSETYPRGELAAARGFAKELGVRLKVIRTRELNDPRFKNNPENRCYFCKKELFLKLKALAKKHGMDFVIDGSNRDDLADYRPGAVAKKESGVVSPLQDVGLTKKEIRLSAKKLGLSVWSKPALACLASRIPYHSKISRRRLLKIDHVEEMLRRVFKIRGNLRVRDFGAFARVEVDKKEIGKLTKAGKAVFLLKRLGYQDAVVDLKGYRIGSLNDGLRKK